MTTPTTHPVSQPPQMPLSRKSSSSPSPIPSTPSSIYPFPLKQTDIDAAGNAANFVHSTEQPPPHRRRLTRVRKLRHLTDHDVGLHLTDDSSLLASPPPSLKSRSSGGSEHWSSSAVPQPLPLPESPLTRRPESTGPNPGQFQLGSPCVDRSGFAFGRKTMDHDTLINMKSWSNMDRSCDPTTASTKFNLRVNIPVASFLIGHSSCKDRAISRDTDSESIYDSRLRVATKSAPTSVFSSPVTSPRRSSNVDFTDHFITAQEFHDNPVGHPSKVSPPLTVQSPDHSSLRSPGCRSPFLNLKILDGPQHRFHSRAWPENNHVDAHPLPLPLPPGASPPAQSSVQRQSSAKLHSFESQFSVKGQWQKGKLIGRGTFGSVYHATNLETGASCAMKEVDLILDDPNSSNCIKQLEQEIKILRQLQHPNIVQYYGSETVGDHLCIYMEYVHPGSVDKFVRANGEAMTESVVRNFTWHILSGLAYLHSTKTIHRDIKGANLLVDASGTVKLADFGMAKVLTGKSYDLSLKGSPYWMAPEVMKAAMMKDDNPDLAYAVDIWSLGCTIIEMLTGRPPWSDFEGPQAMFKVLHNSPSIPETLSSAGKDFLQRCFERDPANRPSAAKLLEHAFVQNLHDQEALVRPQLYPREDPEENSRSPKDSTARNRDVIRASMSSRIINKIQKFIGR
ncbi:mitogen-activated protein kinase kinase kinase 5-like isoform X2 [Prosopis cineraria]|uniref:mitogen-activated protein kinase kinase kinase 5-like isoform X2 n=1 Tax=Prosopis cineraria TaxID=364024 RepID=UPI00240F036E|nr:mitogen-activated protein kinase kinase kinase 5-like isoform X2 [Prosopis cineraria]